MILTFNIVINFDSIASNDIVVKDIAKQATKDILYYVMDDIIH